MSWIEKIPNATSVTFHLIMQGFWADTFNMARLQNCPDITILVCHGIVSGVTHAVGHAGVYRDIVHVVCHGASHAVNWGSQNFFTLTVQHLLHGNTNHLHISSSTSSSVTSPNTTSTITSTNLKKKQFQSKCLFRVLAWVNDLSHCPHGCNFSPVWMSKWVLMLPVCQNAFLHSVQLCGFSPLWSSDEYMLIQTLSLSVWHFTLATHVHGWGFSSM